MNHLLIQADARRLPMAAGSVHTVVTSPPYWNLRDYSCAGQIGLEATLDLFVAAMVRVFREVYRVLRDDGTCWMNLGDGFGPGKQLLMMPHRVALALQADGWIVRMDICWAKPNPMPESVTDRPTKAHEYIFLLSKRERYFFDSDAVREGCSSTSHGSPNVVPGEKNILLGKTNGVSGGLGKWTSEDKEAGRNLRSVWSIPSEAYPGAHFATYPRKLVAPCIRAGTSQRGVCPTCGAPWERVTERLGINPGDSKYAPGSNVQNFGGVGTKAMGGGSVRQAWLDAHPTQTLGWRPTCQCFPADIPIEQVREAWPIPATVFDPFAGSGTTGVVALALGRNFVGVDLSAKYLHMAERRISRPHARPARENGHEALPLFAGLEV